MPKLPISVTLERDNLIWLKARTAAAKARSLSEMLDQIVSDARRSGRVAAASVRSVVGTIDISEDDPDLSAADEYLRALFERSTRASGRGEGPRAAAPARRARRG